VKLLIQRSSLLRLCDALPTLVAITTDATCSPANVTWAPPATRAADDDFKAFVTRVLVSLKASPQADLDRCEPAYSYAEAGARLRRLPHEKLATVSSGWPLHIIASSDRRLYRAAGLYRCVRRHLWRTAVHSHRRCVKTACQKLWWPVTGSCTPSFCAVAVAFLRWRRRWEWVICMTELLGRPNAAPFGLIAWLASAPIGPVAWTDATQSWLLDHLLGSELLNSFEDMLAEELARPQAEQIAWRREWADRASCTCWVCVGQGTRSRPARLFMPGSTSTGVRGTVPAGARHYSSHLASIARIEH
jgi:hypothetical protein